MGLAIIPCDNVSRIHGAAEPPFGVSVIALGCEYSKDCSPMILLLRAADKSRTFSTASVKPGIRSLGSYVSFRRLRTCRGASSPSVGLGRSAALNARSVPLCGAVIGTVPDGAYGKPRPAAFRSAGRGGSAVVLLLHCRARFFLIDWLSNGISLPIRYCP
jgi:hypothetical protein